MNLKTISVLATILVTFTVLFASCNDNETTVKALSLSKNANIYGFSMKGTPVTRMDTLNYPALEKAKFVIDINQHLIYNPDSLPYLTNMNASFETKIQFGKAEDTPSKVELIYYSGSGKNDTIWNRTDSIDFRQLEGFRIHAADGNNNTQYSIRFRIHQIDPDTILWEKKSKLAENISKQHTVTDSVKFYTFYPSGANIAVRSYDGVSDVWSAKTSTALPSNTRLESITVFENKFFAVDEDGKSYSSTNASSWSMVANKNIHSILGVVPAVKAGDPDLLLTVQKNGSLYQFASTTDMQNFTILNIKAASANNDIDDKTFPSVEFSSAIDRDNSCILLTGGKDFVGNLKGTTWKVNLNTKGEIEYTPTSRWEVNNVVKAKEARETFVYDKRLYAVNDSVFAISHNQGHDWSVAPLKQALHADMPQTTGQSVMVDKENFIWVFSGMPNQNIDVWKGRLNRLIPKP